MRHPIAEIIEDVLSNKDFKIHKGLEHFSKEHLEKMEKDRDFKWEVFSDLVLYSYKEKCRKKPMHYVLMDRVIQQYDYFSCVDWEKVLFYKAQLRKNRNDRKNLVEKGNVNGV